MQELLKPLKTESLKDVFVSRFENLILSWISGSNWPA